MMFKHLGRFVVLAVCLFTIAIVMVGCGADEDDPPPPPPPPPVEETPAENLVGSYTLVSTQRGGKTVFPPDLSGKMFLSPPGGIRSSIYLGLGDDLTPFIEFTWSADSTHLTLGGDRTPYTWDGTHLSFAVPDPDGGFFYLRWRKD